MTDMPTSNLRWLLASRPDGRPVPADFRLDQGEIPAISGTDVLVRHRIVSIDPYVRGRMSAAESYSRPIEIGSPIAGVALGDVVQSGAPEFAPGDTVMIGGGDLPGGGWQQFSVAEPGMVRRIDTQGLPETAFFGPLGMPGFTAWCGLTKIGRPKPGETVVVSAGTGAVGSMVGQFARLAGCRTVAIASGPEKCAFATETLGYDAAINRRAPDFPDRLAAACPDGVDIYFENVGGQVAEAVRPLLNDFARIPVCGLISQYNAWGAETPDESHAAFMRDVLVKRLTLTGFIISDFFADRPAFLDHARPLVAEGKIRWKDDIVEGLEGAPEAFLGLLEGRNFGKVLIRV